MKGETGRLDFVQINNSERREHNEKGMQHTGKIFEHISEKRFYLKYTKNT